MAGTFTIDSKAAKSPVVATDQVLIQETGGGTVKKALFSVLADFVLKTVNGLTDKPTPASTDNFNIMESGGTIKKLSLANLWTYLLGLIRPVILVPVTASKTTDYAFTDTDGIAIAEFDTSSGACIATLPLIANNVGRRIRVVLSKNDASLDKVTVKSHATDGSKMTGDALAEVWLMEQGDYIDVYASPTSGNWEVLSESVTCEMEFDTYAGYGDANNNKIIRYTNAPILVGNMATENHSSGYSSNTKGLEITISRSGRYAVIVTHNTSGAATDTIGVSVNSNQLTTAIQTITQIHRKVMSTIFTNFVSSASVEIRFKKGNVIRPHVGSSLIPGTPAFCKVILSYKGQ